MPKLTDIKKILVIGSGPIVIGQAAEFDYAGTQACLALKEEGYQVVLVNSNPATIMTDTRIADKVYMEPLNLEYVAKIIRYERPDAILPSLGGDVYKRQGIARVMLTNPDMLVMDEPTSALDIINEKGLLKTLDEEYKEDVYKRQPYKRYSRRHKRRNKNLLVQPHRGKKQKRPCSGL